MITIKTKNGQYWHLFEDDGKSFVACCPLGGGFNTRIPRADVIDWNAKPNEVPLRLVDIGFDGETICQGYIGAHKWNGWECPYVDEANLALFLRAMGENGAIKMSLEGKTLVVNHTDVNEIERVEPEAIKYEGRQVEAWQIGLGFIWEETSAPAQAD